MEPRERPRGRRNPSLGPSSWTGSTETTGSFMTWRIVQNGSKRMVTSDLLVWQPAGPNSFSGIACKHGSGQAVLHSFFLRGARDGGQVGAGLPEGLLYNGSTHRKYFLSFPNGEGGPPSGGGRGAPHHHLRWSPAPSRGGQIYQNLHRNFVQQPSGKAAALEKAPRRKSGAKRRRKGKTFRIPQPRDNRPERNVPERERRKRI